MAREERQKEALWYKVEEIVEPMFRGVVGFPPENPFRVSIGYFVVEVKITDEEWDFEIVDEIL